MIRKKKSKKVIETQHVFTENNQVFIKNESSYKKSTRTVWSPIPFKWVSIAKVQETLVLK
ncbi:hypothetical protein DFQ03_0011 [Maribacter caenipelagi]|uniref:Uncharacterized protein n=2 Tax=Maribacter TaxID=252356 RepID=A0A4V3E3F9_9FLAO|nr:MULTISPECIES: hypothetical protein [Maribacter]TDS20758.1 hypothetical protein DFQ03_0011 [Maribacter caenipelagi]VXC20391.1 conserved hypothetical protein [Maribacter litoralis]